MKTKLVLIAFLAAMLTGCGNDDLPQLNDNLPDGELPEVVTSRNVRAISRYIGRHHRSASRSAETVLSPYIVDGDTVMYIANYGDGWEVFSNDPRVPMVLMQCDKGNFYPTDLDNESPFDALFQNTAHYLSSVKKADFAPTDTINSEWMAFGIETLGVDGPEKDPDSDGKYHWKYVGCSERTYHDTYTPVGGRLVTLWHPEAPFNSYTPYIGENHASLGCMAVAIGQYLYFTHYKDNRPEKTVTHATYNAGSNLYTFSGSSSTIWDSFIEREANTSNTDATAIFLGWIAQKIDTEFDESNSFVHTFNKPLTFFNEQTGLNAYQSKYSKYSVKEILEKGYPVLIRASIADDIVKIGHVWLIDYYDSEWTTYNDYYVYVKSSQEPNLDEDEDLDDFFDDLSVEKIKALYGDVDIDIKTSYVDKTYLMFNWGLKNGLASEVRYDANVPTWTNVDFMYNQDHYIYYFN